MVHVARIAHGTLQISAAAGPNKHGVRIAESIWAKGRSRVGALLPATVKAGIIKRRRHGVGHRGLVRVGFFTSLACLWFLGVAFAGLIMAQMANVALDTPGTRSLLREKLVFAKLQV